MLPWEADHHLLERLDEWSDVASRPDGECYIGCPECGRFWDIFELMHLDPKGHIGAGGLPCRCDRVPVRFADLAGDWNDVEEPPYGL